MVRLQQLFNHAVTPTIAEGNDEEDDSFEEENVRPPVPGQSAMQRVLERRKEREAETKEVHHHTLAEALGLEHHNSPNKEQKEEEEEVHLEPGQKAVRGGIKRPLAGFCILNLVISPLSVFFFGCVVGFWMDYVEGNKWGTAFWHVSMRVATSPPVTKYQPTTPLGETLDTMICVFGLTLSCCIYVMSSMLLLVKTLADALSPDSWIKAFFVLWVFTPVFILVWCVIFGFLLDWMDGEPLFTGFFYAVSSLTHIANPITNFTPQGIHTRIFCVMLGALSKGFTGVIIGIVLAVKPVSGLMDKFNKFYSTIFIVNVKPELKEEDFYFGGGYGRRGSFGTVYSDAGGLGA